MRNLIKFLVFMLAVSVFAMAQGPAKLRPLSWNGGSTTAQIVATGVDTSDNFVAFNEFKMNGHTSRRVPGAFNWSMRGVETSTTDSCNVVFTLQWSNDQTFWVDDALLTLTSTGGTALTVTGGADMTDAISHLYGRVIATGLHAAGDTVNVGGSVLKVFND